MSAAKDGGPAFPTEGRASYNGHGDYSVRFAGGMSLRDWFAGQALAGLCANPKAGDWWGVGSETDAAERASRIADAMLAARSTGEG